MNIFQNNNSGVYQLWPTQIRWFDLQNTLSEEYNKELEALAVSKVNVSEEFLGERRVLDFHEVDALAVRPLVKEIKNCIMQYVSYEVKELTLRAVVMVNGSHISTHNEAHESDLMIAYWPSGKNFPLGTNPNMRVDKKVAPAFVVEDPSRSLTDLRLPHETRHSISIHPRPGLLVIGPAHLPHNMTPYIGCKPFVHIVAQVRLDFPKNYEDRFFTL